MSRVVTNTGTATIYPSGYISKTIDGSWYLIEGTSNANKGYDQNTSSYCNIGLARGSGAYTYAYFTFNTSGIPSNATISSISCIARVYCSNGTSTNIASKGAKMCSGTTEKTEAVSATTTASNRTFSMGTWTRAELDDVRLKMFATRGTKNVNSNYYLRFYGATLTIGYSYDVTLYSISASSEVSGITVSVSSAEVEQGGSSDITINGTIGSFSLFDGDTDVTSQLDTTGQNPVYHLSNIDADHTITISAPISTKQPIYVKSNGSWVSVDKMFFKQGGTWKEIDTLYMKDNGSWKS